MNVAGMLAHLCKASLMALGEVHVAPRGISALRVFPLKHLLKYLLLYVVPFPRSAGTSPELLSVSTIIDGMRADCEHGS